MTTIGQRIVRGDVRAGDTINLEQVRTELNVSQTVVREALRVLAAKGLIGARTRVGTYVRDASEWNLLDEDVLRWELEADGQEALFVQFGEMRELIEPGAAALAARSRTDEHVARLRDMLEIMALSDDDAGRIVDADLVFHRTIFAATGNALVLRQGRLIEIGLRARDTIVHENHVSIRLGLDLHTAVADAIEREDAETAETMMRRLVSSATADAVRMHQRGGTPTPPR